MSAALRRPAFADLAYGATAGESSTCSKSSAPDMYDIAYVARRRIAVPQCESRQQEIAIHQRRWRRVAPGPEA